MDAKVLFATEKLVVKLDNKSTADNVEQAIQDAGFRYNSGLSSTKPQPNSGWKAIVKQNSSIIAIALSMAIAALLKPISPVFSEWMFTLTCLAGLYPIGKKALQLAKSGIPFAIETLMSVAAVGALYLGETAWLQWYSCCLWLVSA